MLAGSTRRLVRQLLIHQTNHKFLVGLAQAILLNKFVPGQPRGRDGNGVCHINSMIPRFTLFGVGIMPTLAAWGLYQLWKAKQG
jgi:hypothetical protein